MAAKKLSKDMDIAADFFSSSTPSSEPTKKEAATTNIKPISSNNEKQTSSNIKKNLGGRPIKTGLKNENFTLTMNPELYEKLKLIADARCRGNFSSLINDAINVYCKENNIQLSEIVIDPEILEIYKIKQDKKRAKNKKV